MKILHMADVHLDSVLNTHLQDEKRRERRQEILSSFEETIEYATANGIRHVIIAGDLFDTEIVNRLTCNIVYRCIMEHKDISFYYLKGNHDADSFISNLEEKPENLFLFSDEWTAYELHKGIMLYGIELNRRNSNSVYDTLKLNLSDYNIVTLHGQAEEYEAKDRAENIALGRLKNTGIDYLALGHVHEYSCGMLDKRGKWCYPGCLEPRGFDEGGSHGFCVLEIDEQTHESEQIFIANNKREYVEVRADITGCVDSVEALRTVRNSVDSKAGKKDLLKLVLVGKIDAESEINTDYIYHSMKNDFYYLKISDETKVAFDISRYEFDQSLKGEFIRSVRGDESLDEDTKGRIIRAGLMLLAGEEYSYENY